MGRQSCFHSLVISTAVIHRGKLPSALSLQTIFLYWAGCFEKHLLPWTAMGFCPSLTTWAHPCEYSSPVTRAVKDVLDQKGSVKCPTWLPWVSCAVIHTDLHLGPSALVELDCRPCCFLLSMNFSRRNCMPLKNLCKELAHPSSTRIHVCVSPRLPAGPHLTWSPSKWIQRF